MANANPGTALAAALSLVFNASYADARVRIAQSSTQTLAACQSTCEVQATVCRSSCTINAAANTGNTSQAVAAQLNQCFIDCTRVLLVCKQACISAGLQ